MGVIPIGILGKSKICTRESLAHLKLKNTAILFLRGLGYQDIRTEVCLGVRPTIFGDVSGNHSPSSGNQNHSIAIVECGGSKHKKLVRASEIVEYIYILPYGEEIPFLWNKHSEICPTCGHIINH